MRERSVVRVSVMPSAKWDWSGSSEVDVKGSTMRDKRGGSASNPS